MQDTATQRQRIAALLQSETLTVREMSQILGIKEKDIPQHLEHISKTVKSSGQRLGQEPAECLNCGFVFHERQRFTKPGRCPQCRRGPIQGARYFIL